MSILLIAAIIGVVIIMALLAIIAVLSAPNEEVSDLNKSIAYTNIMNNVKGK